MTIEKYLIGKLAGVEEHLPVYAEKPEDAPDRYLVVEVIGSGMSNQIKNATVAVRSYDKTLAGAAALNDKVKDFMETLWHENEISRCRISTEYAINSIAMMQYKYQSIWDIVHYL